MRPTSVFIFATLLAITGCSAPPRDGSPATESAENTSETIDDPALETATNDVAMNATDGMNAADGAEMTSDAPSNASDTAANASDNAASPVLRSLVDCPILRRRTSAAQCTSVTEQAASLEQGVGAFAAPSAMVVGQAEDVSFAVGKKEDAEETAASVGGNMTTTVQVRTRIGRFMTATLTGGGFDIEAAGTPERDLGASASEVWTWRVTPRQQGPRTLMLTVKVDAVDEDGQRTRITLSSKTVAVNVGVTASDRRRSAIKEVKDTIDETGTIWPSLEKWLAGLAGVLLVLGLVIWRFKLLGKKPEEATPAPTPAPDASGEPEVPAAPAEGEDAAKE